MKRREAEKEMEEREDIEMCKKKAETDQIFLLYQQEKNKKRSEDAQALSEYHLKQAVNKFSQNNSIKFFFLQQQRKDHERGLKTTEIEECQLDKHVNEIEKQQFQDYAGRVISYMEENGRNTYPMKRVFSFQFFFYNIFNIFIQVYNEEMKRFDQWSQGYKKSDSGETKLRSKDKKSLNDTKKNLGFQWDMPNK